MHIITYRTSSQGAWQADIEDNRRVVAVTAAYSYDTFTPIGPGIVPASEIPDPQNYVLSRTSMIKYCRIVTQN